MIQIKDRHNGKVLFEFVSATTMKEAVVEAVKKGANLSGAYLSGANLSGADLSGANLSGANLGKQWIVQGSCRSDGYQFFLQMFTGDKVPMVKAGCRMFSLPQAWKHWNETREGQDLLQETIVIIDCMVELAIIRGFCVRQMNGAIVAKRK